MFGSRRPASFLSPQEAKRLKSQLKVYVRDYPDASAETLAELWHDEQITLAEGTWLEPYLHTSHWIREVIQTISLLRREAAQKVKTKDIRARAKESYLDRQPATENQKKYLTKLTKKRPELVPAPIETLSKLQASRLIKLALQS